jgi:hypothetical protein
MYAPARVRSVAHAAALSAASGTRRAPASTSIRRIHGLNDNSPDSGDTFQISDETNRRKIERKSLNVPVNDPIVFTFSMTGTGTHSAPRTVIRVKLATAPSRARDSASSPRASFRPHDQ